MEIYTLAPDGMVDDIVEGVHSFIWTERYSAYGDFELLLKLTPENLRQFRQSRKLIHSKSDRVMVINYLERISKDGQRLLLVKGWSMEYLLLDKIARSEATTFPYKWRTIRRPAVAARNIYREIMYEGLRSPKDILPDVNINENPIPNAIPEPTEEVLFEFEPRPVYDVVKTICDSFDLGFRITRNHTTGQLTFRVYTGFDRTAGQFVNEGVLFNESLGNLKNVSDINSIVGHKNVAWVYSEQGALEVFAPGISSSTSGLGRRVLTVKADKLEGTPTQAEINEHLRQRGRTALNDYRVVKAFDGEVSETSPYVYGVHYGLGDLVEYQSVTNESDDSSIMMVTEQIFALDNQGLRSYPTLTLKSFDDGN